MNVLDKYAQWTVDLIREDVKKHTFPYAVMMQHIQGDFNLGTVIRNANAFGAKELFYYGKKHYDHRGTVGTQHYTSVKFLKEYQEVVNLLDKYTLVALECNVESQPMTNFTWPKNPLIVLGEELAGINPEVMSLCKHVVHIPQYGSVRSINVGTASGIAMCDFVNKFNKEVL